VSAARRAGAGGLAALAAWALAAWALAAWALAAAACEGERRPPPAASGSDSSAGSADSGSPRAAPAASAPADPDPPPLPPDERARLPGVLWYVEDSTGVPSGQGGSSSLRSGRAQSSAVDHRPAHRLVRLAGGARTEVTAPGGDLFPSTQALPDGRLVAIASRGDGAPDSEQLALVGPGGAVERIGPAAAAVRSPAVDPRGRWIVIAANTDGHSDLYRVELAPAAAAAGKPPPRLTRDPQGNFEPALLGDDAIAFTSSRDGDSEIYRMPAAGGKAQRLTAFHRDDWGPAPSPDGKAIAFLSDRLGRARIFLIAADGTGVHRLTDRKDADRDEAAPVWSPDGRSIAYLVEGGGESNLWLRDVATGRERVLTPLRARDAEPCFSPDGAWIAVSRGRTQREGDLWLLPTAGGPARRLTAAPGLERLPRWLR
jgi:TolB protein